MLTRHLPRKLCRNIQTSQIDNSSSKVSEQTISTTFHPLFQTHITDDNRRRLGLSQERISRRLNRSYLGLVFWSLIEDSKTHLVTQPLCHLFLRMQRIFTSRLLWFYLMKNLKMSSLPIETMFFILHLILLLQKSLKPSKLLKWNFRISKTKLVDFQMI